LTSSRHEIIPTTPDPEWHRTLQAEPTNPKTGGHRPISPKAGPGRPVGPSDVRSIPAGLDTERIFQPRVQVSGQVGDPPTAQVKVGTVDHTRADGAGRSPAQCERSFAHPPTKAGTDRVIGPGLTNTPGRNVGVQAEPAGASLTLSTLAVPDVGVPGRGTAGRGGRPPARATGSTRPRQPLPPGLVSTRQVRRARMSGFCSAAKPAEQQPAGQPKPSRLQRSAAVPETTDCPQPAVR